LDLGTIVVCGRLRVAADEGRPSLFLCLVFCDVYYFSYEDRISIGIGEIRVLVRFLVLKSGLFPELPERKGFGRSEVVARRDDVTKIMAV
jgi:hypothetical protein